MGSEFVRKLDHGIWCILSSKHAEIQLMETPDLLYPKLLELELARKCLVGYSQDIVIQAICFVWRISTYLIVVENVPLSNP